MKTSTRIMVKKHGWRVDRFIHNYIYFLFYYPYVKAVCFILPLLNHLTWFKPLVPAGKMTFARYHSKVLSFDDTRKIFEINEDISVITEQNKRIIPYKYATKIIFQEPEFIAVMDCPCKKSLNAPDETINSCIAVGKGLASFWLDHCEKYNVRQISQEEALGIISDLRKKGHITQAFFKVATGGSTGVICNCHPETCANLKATAVGRKIDTALSMTAKSGYLTKHNAEKCGQCKKCEQSCRFNCLSFSDGGRTSDNENCLGCGLCVDACPEGALSLYINSDELLPLDLELARGFVQECDN